MSNLDTTAALAFVAVLATASLLALTARSVWRSETVSTPAEWALAGRRFGTVTTWFLLGGTIYTAYTFAAVPALVSSAGALGFFALPYTIIVYPLAFWLLPRLWREARDMGAVTVADVVRIRYDSAGLALAVALTGILATMPYVALQVVGVRSVLAALGAYPEGITGDAILAAVFAVLAVATYRSGLRAPALISFVKGALLFVGVAVVTVLVLRRLDGPAAMFDRIEHRAAGDQAHVDFLALDPSLAMAYLTLAVGSALALLMYPHLLTAAFAAKSEGVLRVNAVALLAWTALLGAFAVLGLAAYAWGAGGGGEATVLEMVEQTTPSWFTGIFFGSLAVGALVPAAVMSVAAAMLFTRNVYAEYVNRRCTPEQQTGVARFVSLLVKVGALGFVILLAEQDAINLQLLGGVWMLQVFPAVALGLLTRWLQAPALFAGWAAGMLTGTYLVTRGGFAAVVEVAGVQVYAALAALVVNIAVAVLVNAAALRLAPTRGLLRHRRVR
ncbi:MULTISPECIES: sodium:solute symporter family protein [Nocardioides]|uniref:Sodium:solute symporter n=1 Tax=Nocardioides vastitatis TaxID=2568655 RepID=A0ABW0ZND5_9ACTN|nr:sodium:solute symporter [Nocardioides sp.]THJ09196.1 sodium:solute symporter [Nocardioides sp.]